MKRFFAALATITLIVITVPVAHASSTIVLTEPTHRQINGQFIDDGLAASIAGTGRLGELVFDPPQGNRTWIIDPALIEEVTAMASGYTLASGAPGVGELFAQTWLSQLQHAIVSDTVVAMAYGNPSSYWVNQLSPHEANYVLTLSQDLLERLLGRGVAPATHYQSQSKFQMSDTDISLLKTDSTDFNVTAAYIDPTQIDTYRLSLIKILNPNLTKDRREFLIRDLTSSAYLQMHLIHLSVGKFTVTSSHQDLPITLSNGFPNDVKVNLTVVPTNLKVEVGSLSQQVIPAKSKNYRSDIRNFWAYY
ncbi:MAG: hypothetical protein WDN07_01345 [Actinomycetota bacterium]